MTDSVPDIWRRGTADRLAALAADDIVFSSPVADYHGRDRACHLLRLVPRTMEQIETTGRWVEGNAGVTAFTARVADEPIQGIVHERRDGSGSLEHVTLYLRPLHAMRAAINRMKGLLDDDPLPGPPS